MKTVTNLLGLLAVVWLFSFLFILASGDYPTFLDWITAADIILAFLISKIVDNHNLARTSMARCEAR